MAHDVDIEHLTEPHIEPVSHDIGLTPITLGFSFLAGLGIVLMIIALGVGVIGGNTEATANNSSLITLLFVAGLLFFIAGAVAWVSVTQPFRNFDNINVPADDPGHGHEDHHDENALALSDEQGLSIPATSGQALTQSHGAAGHDAMTSHSASGSHH